jgi:hypothetical protein
VNILELFAHIGLKADTGPAESFNKTVGNIKGQLVGAIAGTLSLAAAIGAVNDQFNKALGMKRFADDTGESVEEMQKWKAVAQQVSGAGDSVAASIRAISSNQAKIRLGQGNISGYQLLGIDSRSDPFRVLEALRTKTQGLSQSMRRNIASQFGISNDLVATLELTNEQFDEMAANAFVIPAANIEAMNRARASLETVKNAANFLVAKFVTALAPSIDTVSKKVAEFVRNYGEKLAEWIRKLVTMVLRVVDLIDKTIRMTIGWKNALIALAAVFFMLNSAILMPVAALVLFMAILEDIYLYSQGKDSLIGRFLEGMPELKKVFDTLLGSIQLVAEALGAVFSGDFSKLDEMAAKWGLFGDAVQVVARALGIINEGLSSESFEETKKGIKEKGFMQEYADQWGNLFNIIKDTDWLGSKNQPAPAAAPVTVNNNPVITISGASNPEVTGRYAAEAIARENQKAFDRLAGEKKEK